jgi:acetylserotonin N-methyltransferase
MALPDPSLVIDLIEAFRRSQTMFTADAFGVFDRLERAPAAVENLAVDLGVDAGSLERLLDGCASLGLLRKHEGVYSNQPVASAYLCRSSPQSLAGYVRYSGEALYPMWAHLPAAIREGAPRWEQTFGLNGPIFNGFFRTEAAMQDFLLGMHGFGMLTSPGVVRAFDLSRYRRLVDLGGATGHLAIAACERYPSLDAVVFDLPTTIHLARETVTHSAAADRVRVVGGDFFTDDLPPADIYALGRILHDWDDAKIAVLLGRILRRLPEGGALLVAEKLLRDDKTGPVAATMQSLNMLVVAEGRERSLPEYAELLTAAGFIDVQGRQTGTPLDAILAVKPQTAMLDMP